MPSKTQRRDLPRPHSSRRGARIGAGVAAAAAASAGLLATAAPAAATLDGPSPGAARNVTAAPASTLQVGSAGSDVTKVQRALGLPDSGHFDARTAGAVSAFQRADGLAADGVVGVQTWDALFNITPPAPASPDSGSGARSESALRANSSSSATPTQSQGSATSTGGYSVPGSIVQCESGGNYSAVNPSSGAGGAYQILPSTWQAYGGQGLPQDASPAEQSRIAGEIYAAQGPSAWSCS